MELNGAGAIVTGGASGLGEATAQALAGGGASVVLIDLNAELGNKLAAELGGVFVAADVADPEEVAAAVTAASDMGPLRVLVNCAGIGAAARTVDREGNPHSLEGFERIIRVNLIGTFNCLRLAAAAMSKTEPLEDGERGVVVNTASAAAFDGQIGQAAYSASKGGIVGMTLPIARDLAAIGVRVNTIAPGLIDTPIYGTGEKSEQFKEHLGKSVLFPTRLGYASEFASMVLEIVRNRYMNAESFRLDGGIRMPPLVAAISGTWDPAFVGVGEALAASLEAGTDVGASACVSLDGRVVADVWGGTVDEAGTRPWEQDTIINVFSTTKTMTFLSALVLADRGELDFSAPVARSWPEFAAAGKEGVLVRHLMGHTAGLSGWTEPLTLDDVCDWGRCTSALAAQAPWWEPGTAAGYHALSQGYLVGEVVRRITGQTLGTFFANEIAGPLGADFHIATGPEHDHRIAPVIPCGPLDAVGGPDSISARTLRNPPLQPGVANESAWRRCESPAANGHGNARSVVAVQSVLANGGEVGGVRLLSEAGCQTIFEKQFQGTDLVLGVPMTYGMGYGLNSEEMPLSPNPRTCFWGGWGGSLVVIDMDARLCVSYVMNKMAEGTLGDTRGAMILFAAYQALQS